jgi:hypothetical protein
MYYYLFIPFKYESWLAVRMTIYIPDDLWESATEGETEVNASRLIQEALRNSISQRKLPAAFARERPAGSEEAIKFARERLLLEAREQYERGYRTAAEAAFHIPWGALDELHEYEWDIRRWRARMHGLDREGFGWSAVAFQGNDYEGLGGKTMTDLLNHYLGWHEMDIASPTFEMGFSDALRDVWESVRSADPNAEPGVEN